MHVIAAVVCGLLGSLVGSELELVARRTPVHQSMRIARHCLRCGTPSSRMQRFGLLARVARRNRCLTCASPVWSPVPWFPLATAAVFATFAGRFGWAWALPAYLAFSAALVALTVVDLRHSIIPTRIVRPTLYACLAWLALTAVIEGSSDRLLTAATGLLMAGGFFFVVWFVHPRGMGFGDVRLSALIGLLAGWLGLGTVVLAVMLGLLIGSVAGVVVLVAGVRGRKDPIPYGPFLALGSIVAILWGADLQDWWTGDSPS